LYFKLRLDLRCLNLLVANENGAYSGIAKKSLLDMLMNEHVSIGQKLFVVNIYMENLGEFGNYGAIVAFLLLSTIEFEGNECMARIRDDCLNIFIKWSSDITVELK
jgi:hypothetical protein